MFQGIKSEKATKGYHRFRYFSRLKFPFPKVCVIVVTTSVVRLPAKKRMNSLLQKRKFIFENYLIRQVSNSFFTFQDAGSPNLFGYPFGGFPQQVGASNKTSKDFLKLAQLFLLRKLNFRTPNQEERNEH